MNKNRIPSALVAHLIAELGQSHPDWMDQYEMADFSAGVTEDLVDLLNSAPSGFAAGLVYGKMTTIQTTVGLSTLHSMSHMAEVVEFAPRKQQFEVLHAAGRMRLIGTQPAFDRPSIPAVC